MLDQSQQENLQAGPATDQSRSSLATVEEQTQHLIQQLWKLSLTVYNYKNDSEGLLKTRLNDIISSLSEMQRIEQSHDIRIPLSMLECLDEGTNPDLILKQQLQVLVDKNQKTNGRIQSILLLKQELEKEMNQLMPFEPESQH